MTDHEKDEGFLSRWARRKAEARRGGVAPAESAPGNAAPAERTARADERPPVAPTEPEGTPPAQDQPTLADVEVLTPQSDFTRFVSVGVDPEVKNAALKKMFADPHFNVMDGLDTSIDDYSRPDPIPADMLAKMTQSEHLELASRRLAAPPSPVDEVARRTASDVAPSAADDAPLPEPIAADENVDLQLQPHDAAGRAGAEPGAAEDIGREQRRAR